MYSFQISEVLDQAWALTKKYGLLLAVILFGIGIAAQLIPTADTAVLTSAATELQEALQSGEDPSEALTEFYTQYAAAVNPALATLVSLIKTALTAAFTLILLSLVKGERTDVSFDPVKKPVMTYVKYIGVSILTGIIAGIGCLFCILPGIWLGVKLSLAPYYILDHDDMGIGEAIKASWNATSGNFWSLLGLYILAALIAAVGLLACCIGFYYTSVIAAFAGVIVYLILSGFYAKQGQTIEA